MRLSLEQDVTATEANLGSPGKPNGKTCRVGLISPCSGNLGNAAILSATIEHVRKRVPEAEFVGITLSPSDTRWRHGIEAFPITTISRSNYSPGVSDGAAATRRVLYATIKRWLKRIPLLSTLVRPFRTFVAEVVHTVAAARVVRSLDYLIVPGGGALDEFWGGPWGHPWTLCRWSVLSWLYGVPFSFLSVGKCVLNSRLSRFFARTALRIAQYRSFRDEESKLAVQRLINAKSDVVCPDLAFSYACPRPPMDRTEADGTGLVVAVSPIAYCDPRVWPEKDGQRYRAYISKLAEMVRWLLEQGHRVLLFATDSPDLAPIHDLLSMLPNAGGVEVLSGPPEQSTDGLLEGICRADLVIASRLHGVILSHLITLPVLAISYDLKVDSHMSMMGQSEYQVRIDHFSLDTLIDRFNALKLARARETRQLRATTDHFRLLVEEQYDRIFGLARAQTVKNTCHDETESLRR